MSPIYVVCDGKISSDRYGNPTGQSSCCGGCCRSVTIENKFTLTPPFYTECRVEAESPVVQRNSMNDGSLVLGDGVYIGMMQGIQNYLSMLKIDDPVTISAYEKLNISFEIIKNWLINEMHWDSVDYTANPGSAFKINDFWAPVPRPVPFGGDALGYKDNEYYTHEELLAYGWSFRTGYVSGDNVEYWKQFYCNIEEGDCIPEFEACGDDCKASTVCLTCGFPTFFDENGQMTTVCAQELGTSLDGKLPDGSCVKACPKKKCCLSWVPPRPTIIFTANCCDNCASMGLKQCYTIPVGSNLELTQAEIEVLEFAGFRLEGYNAGITSYKGTRCSSGICDNRKIEYEVQTDNTSWILMIWKPVPDSPEPRYVLSVSASQNTGNSCKIGPLRSYLSEYNTDTQNQNLINGSCVLPNNLNTQQECECGTLYRRICVIPHERYLRYTVNAFPYGTYPQFDVFDPRDLAEAFKDYPEDYFAWKNSIYTNYCAMGASGIWEACEPNDYGLAPNYFYLRCRYVTGYSTPGFNEDPVVNTEVVMYPENWAQWEESPVSDPPYAIWHFQADLVPGWELFEVDGPTSPKIYGLPSTRSPIISEYINGIPAGYPPLSIKKYYYTAFTGRGLEKVPKRKIYKGDQLVGEASAFFTAGRSLSVREFYINQPAGNHYAAVRYQDRFGQVYDGCPGDEVGTPFWCKGQYSEAYNAWYIVDYDPKDPLEQLPAGTVTGEINSHKSCVGQNFSGKQIPVSCGSGLIYDDYLDEPPNTGLIWAWPPNGECLRGDDAVAIWSPGADAGIRQSYVYWGVPWHLEQLGPSAEYGCGDWWGEWNSNDCVLGEPSNSTTFCNVPTPTPAPTPTATPVASGIPNPTSTPCATPQPTIECYSSTYSFTVLCFS